MDVHYPELKIGAIHLKCRKKWVSLKAVELVRRTGDPDHVFPTRWDGYLAGLLEFGASISFYYRD